MSFNPTSADDLLALKNEVLNDPNLYGYNPESTAALMLMLNEKRSSIIVSKPKISSALVRSECTYDAYNGLSVDEQEWLRWVTGSNGSEEENMSTTTDLRTQLTHASNSIWSATTREEMIVKMVAIFDVEGSRAEQLFGFGTTLTKQNWIAARDS